MNVNFPLEVNKRFGFLIKEYGFRVITQEDQGRSWKESAVFTTQHVMIEIYHQLMDHAICVDFIDLEAQDGKALDLATFFKLVDRKLARSFGASIPKDEAELLELLDMYSTALRRHGEPILKGDKRVFAKYREALKTGIGLQPFDGPMRFTG